MSKKRYKWWHGVLFYVGVQAARLAFRAAARGLTNRRTRDTREADRDYYQTERLPVFAPPGVAFPIAWSINSVSSIAGGLYVLNLPAGTKGRNTFLRLQAAAWALFALFDTAYFGLRSPINAALVTFAYSAVTVASLDVALRRMHEPRAAMSLATTGAWLALANPVGAIQAAWNYDQFWNIGPLVEPPQNWVKPTRDRASVSAPFILEREQLVPSPLAEVFAFFADPGNLEILTPEWLRFQILTPQPIKMAAGAKIDYRLSWHGIPLRWRTGISLWGPPYHFEDVQLKGPYKLWHHTHRFAAAAGGTMIKDSVRYALPFGILGRVAHALSVRRNVEQIFEYRHKKISGIFGGDSARH